MSPVTGYSFVYHIELYTLFAALIALGPLVRPARSRTSGKPAASPDLTPQKFGLANLPG
jgi:BCD family chlorophyll transporter-like MFS transporter